MHHLNPFAAATTLAEDSVFDTLVHVVGTGVIVASVIWSAYCLIIYLIKRLSPAGVPANIPVGGVPRPLEPSGSTAAIPPQTIAVIAAAVSFMLDEKYKIISIKHQDSSWEKAGRQAVLSSHRIR